MIRWKAFLYTLGAVLSADLLASLQSGLTWKQAGTHLLIAGLGAACAFFQKHVHDFEDDDR